MYNAMSMTDNTMLILFLLLHIIGDFYLQTSEIAINKDKHYKAVMIHGLLYCIPFVVSVLFLEMNIRLILSLIFICLIHFLVDTGKYLYIKKKENVVKNDILFIVDQGVHVLLILITVMFNLNGNNGGIIIREVWNRFITVLGMDSYQMLRWMFLLSVIAKPANITYSKLFANYKPTNTNNQINDKQDLKTSALIGFMERLIIVIFLYLQQFAAIGLVLTAKSIARYDRISKEKNFSEYYLIGTLYSFIAALAVFMFTF